jgi:two-component system, OmpR family, phosphate regulon sensor histidine kinase PhoR
MIGRRRNTSQQPGGRTARVAILLGALVLLPALFYAGFEISTYSQNENFIREIYRRQLDAILYSVNQYAWDVTSNWANAVSGILDRTQTRQSGETDRALGEYLGRSPGLKGVVLVDSGLTGAHLISFPGDTPGSRIQETIMRAFRGNRDQLLRLSSWQSRDYRKLEPLTLDSTGDAEGLIVLAFAHVGQERDAAYVGLELDQKLFVRTIISAKLTDLAGEEFVLAAGKGSLAAPLVATGEIPAGRELQAKPLWVFPSYAIGITLQGESIDDIVRARLMNNLLLVGAFAILLMGVAWFGFRTIHAELELARARSRLVSNVSHELRTPLALIRMYAETLEMGRLSQDAKKQEYYRTILRESERLTHLVNNILDFSRMETGQKRYSFQPTDVNEVIDGVLQTYSARLNTDGIVPIFDRASSLPLIAGDRDALAEAVINLIDNAVKYRGSSTFLKIRSDMRGEWICVEVEDHGIGISPAHQKKVFDAFYRVEDPLVQSSKGSGIGLSLVKQITEAHGGSVTLNSMPGKGSTFMLLFPVANARGVVAAQGTNRDR